jgi:hypothetical protein
MKIKITLTTIACFLSFSLLFGQFHEMVHMIIGRLICGCWGTQLDFNIWQFCNSCNANTYIASLAGPFFSFLMMWIGVFLLKNQSYAYKLFGFFLIFGNKAFARIFTALMGSGDEITALKIIFNDLQPVTIKIIGAVIVLLFALPPLIFAYKSLKQRYAWLIVIGFSVLPLVFQQFYQFKMLNSFLKSGFLAQIHFMGIADLIHLHTLLMIPIFLCTWRLVLKNSNI